MISIVKFSQLVSVSGISRAKRRGFCRQSVSIELFLFSLFHMQAESSVFDMQLIEREIRDEIESYDVIQESNCIKIMRQVNGIKWISNTNGNEKRRKKERDTSR